MRISIPGISSADRVKIREIAVVTFITKAKILSTAGISPFPQYWAAMSERPMVIASRRRLWINVICPANDTAERESCEITPSIRASDALTRASINC